MQFIWRNTAPAHSLAPNLNTNEVIVSVLAFLRTSCGTANSSVPHRLFAFFLSIPFPPMTLVT